MRAHILIMRSYNNAYVNRAGLAGYCIHARNTSVGKLFVLQAMPAGKSYATEIENPRFAAGIAWRKCHLGSVRWEKKCLQMYFLRGNADAGIAAHPCRSEPPPPCAI